MERPLRFNIMRFQQSKIFYGGVIAIVCALMVCSLLLSYRHSQLANTWVNANSVAPPAVIKAAVAQNSQTALSPNQIKALKIPNRGEEELYFIDFNSPQLCGIGGCLYALYDQQGRLFMSLLLDSNLPRGTPLISVSNRVQNGFYCFNIAQFVKKDNLVSKSEYCYQGTGFIVVNSSFVGG